MSPETDRDGGEGWSAEVVIRPGGSSGDPEEIDARVQPLVDALNAIDGVRTTSSCGGHPNPTVRQRPEDEFYVTFVVDMTDVGWRALTRVTQAVERLKTTDENYPEEG